MRRAFAFAYAALARAREQGFAVLAYVSISRADTDEAPLTAHVTMCGVHPELLPTSPIRRRPRKRSPKSATRTCLLGVQGERTVQVGVRGR